MRTSSKLLVLDPQHRLLLLDSADPGRPGLRWWELPGGGIEPGETPEQAGVREVLEETGVTVPLAAVGPLQWRQEAAFSWRGQRHVTLCEGRLARLTGPRRTPR